MFDSQADAIEWAKSKKYPPPKLVQKADVFERVPLYAPEQIADYINIMTRHGGGLFEGSAAKGALRFNSAIKGYILMSSFFHHMAGGRSWAFGIKHGVKGPHRMVNPISAHKRGLAKVKGFDPVVQLGIKKGLTLFKMQDWNENLMREQGGFMESIARNLGAEKTVKTIEWGKLKREKFTNSLFGRYFAGLKAEAFSVDFANRMAEAIKKGETPNPDLLAERSARLINMDFGGLHLRRLGRHPDVQKAMQLALLAPDWTESNFRTATGMIPGFNKFIADRMNEMPPPPGMEKVYRGFWGGVILKATISTLIAQVALNGIDDSVDFYKSQFASWDQIKRLRWTGVDVTKLYEAVGAEVEPGRRKVFSIAGHFTDPLKLVHPSKLAKGKASPLGRIAMAVGTQSDWRERPFTSIEEFLATGKTVKKSRYQDKEGFYSSLPSLIANQIIGMQPIQIGNLIRYAQGEEDGLSAILKSGGAHISTVYGEKSGSSKYKLPGVVAPKFKSIGIKTKPLKLRTAIQLSK